MVSDTDLYAFYEACFKNEINKVRKSLILMTDKDIDAAEFHGDTALHIASRQGHFKIVFLLLACDASRSIRNNDGQTATQVVSNDSIKKLLLSDTRPSPDLAKTHTRFFNSNSDTEIFEWIDVYQNANRIAYENRKEVKSWLTKVSFVKLLEELDIGYIDKIDFSTDAHRITIKAYMKTAIATQSPFPLVTAYTESTRFFPSINRDLAKFGSDFRFETSRTLRQFGYRDDEAPKDMGQHIFAAILIYHPDFEPYYHTGKTFRGMNITSVDLKSYVLGKIIMTRSFLSTTENRQVAEVFLDTTDRQSHSPVICIYKIIDPHSSLCISRLSKFEYEEEVLILPFIIFHVTAVREGVTDTSEDIWEIELEEMSSA